MQEDSKWRKIKRTLLIIVLVNVWFWIPIGVGVWLVTLGGLPETMWYLVIVGVWLIVCIWNGIGISRTDFI